MLKPPSLIVFDLGGVMVRVTYEWRWAIEGACVPASRSEHFDSKLDDCPGFTAYQAGAINLETYLGQLAGYLGIETAEQALRVHQHILVHPFEGMMEIVGDLHRCGVRTAILSNTNAPHWDEMKHSGRFPAIAALQIPVLSHEVQQEKPHPEIYRSLERIANVSAAQILFFDDLAANVAGARACGWRAEQIDPNAGPALQVREHLIQHAVFEHK